MSVKESLAKVLDEFPEDHLREILDFAMYLSWREEREGWQRFGKAQFARVYGPDEPEYTVKDIKPERSA